MYSIALRELRFYFGNISGYILLIIYLSINTVLLWFLDNPYNILNFNFGDLSPFFLINPFLLCLLIPALSMRSFSQEKINGTIEILVTKPLKPIDIFGGKFFGIGLILLITIAPTLFNIIALSSLLDLQSNLDLGKLISSYVGLFFLSTLFLSLSICCSLVFKNQIASFLTSTLFCYVQYFLFDLIANYFSNPYLYDLIINLGAKTHYDNLISGIIQVNDLIYFIGINFVLFAFGLALIKKGQD